MSKCYEKYDLNEKSCKFVKKCPDGKVRNESFRCVKAPVNNQTYLKQKIQKGKLNAEERLRGRTEILKNLFKSKSDEWLKLEDTNIRDKLKRIRTQTVKRGFDDLTRNVDSLMKKVDNYSKPKRRTRKTKSERRSVNFSLGEMSNTEDLRPSRSFNSKEVNLNEPEPNSHLDEQVRLNSPDTPVMSETNEEKLSKYSKAVSGMFDTLDLSKLNGMSRRKPRSKKPVGTSMNAKPRKSRAKRARVSS
jgi:hypothetical protein